MSDAVEPWGVEFYDFTSGRDAVMVDELGDVHELVVRAGGNGARHGTPVIVGRTGEVDPRVNLFFRTGRMADAAPSTWRRYAYSLVVWLNFLHVFGRSWDQASIGDVEAFKYWRLSDLANDGRIEPTSFDVDRAALKSFYSWAAPRFAVSNPVASATGASSWSGYGVDRVLDSAGDGWDVLRPASVRRRQVKWMVRPAFEQWRDVGLRGYGFDGLRRSGWRGVNEDRDGAFADGLYGTGLRLAEWASVLDVEVPAVGASRYAKAWLAAACIKGGREGREYRIPRSVLRAVAAYTDPVEGSRAEVVHRAQRAGRYDRERGVRIVSGYLPKGRKLLIEGPRGRRAVSVDVIGPDERRRLFRRGPAGLEPVSLWLGVNGLPKKAHGWEDTFQDANVRIARLWADAMSRDGGRRAEWEAESPLWCRPHMCRHSFALKWYSILSLVWERKIEGFTAKESADLRDQIGDIWYQMATLMGHRHPQTTRDTYLEPFNALRVDYLLSLLDDEEAGAVDALVKTVARGSDRVVFPAAVVGGGQR